MTEDVYIATVLHTDRAGRFVVLETSHSEVVIYSHWKMFKDAGFRSVQSGWRFRIQMGVSDKDGQTPVVSKVIEPVDESIGKIDRIGDNQEESTQYVSTDELRTKLCTDDEDLIVVRNAYITEEFETQEFSSKIPVVFIDCCFEKNFRWINARIHGGLWFLNCTFKHHFSLKGSQIDGNAVLFGCDFSGFGGISFRGLHGRSIFLEYGTCGGEDMLWLNELSLSGCVSISGTFTKRVELLACQDVHDAANLEPTLHRVLIGKGDYSHESLSESQFLGGIECRGYQLQGSYEVHNSVISDLILVQMEASHIFVHNCEIRRDVVMCRVQSRSENMGISITNDTIERHLRFSAHSLRGCLNLTDTSVGQIWTLELEEPNCGVPLVNLTRFYAGAARFVPVELVYGAVCRQQLLAPPIFGFLEGAERSRTLTTEHRRALAEAYSSCRNWLAISGHLIEEDHAFFHMRSAKEPKLLKRFLFGGIFGWGIHLWNIMLSNFGLILFFACLYTFLGTGSFLSMVILSAQSFISSFFGQWQNYPPTGILSVLVTLESTLGVIFITVLVGSYIRKLLR